MAFIDYLFAIGPVRKAIWKLWYPFLTRKLRAEEIVFLNYAFETDPPLDIPLEPADEANRACIQLYHHVATQVNFSGKNVLEVSCGHGGGASYITKTLNPVQFTGLDLNPKGIEFCQQRHRQPGLNFVQGDAGHLPFSNGAFDAVVNVEASHCYPDFAKFLVEVARVLKPGGYFLYADFRFSDGISEWEYAMENAPLMIKQNRDISEEVLRGMEMNSARSTELLIRTLPKLLHNLGRDFAGVKGSRIYNALERNELTYRSYCFQKSL